MDDNEINHSNETNNINNSKINSETKSNHSKENSNNKSQNDNNSLNNLINVHEISTKIEGNAKMKKLTFFLNRREREFHEAEQKYLQLQKEIKEIINSPDISEYSKLLNQNSKIISIFSELNSIMNIFTKNAPWSRNNINHSNLNTSKNDIKIHIEANNTKILHQYNNEFKYLDNKIKILSDPSHKNYLNQEKELLKEQIEYYEKENKNLKRIQEINEVLMSKNLKYPLLKQMMVNKMEADYLHLQESYELLKINSEKKKKIIEENDIKIQELLNLKESLEKMAKELYNITEFFDIKQLKLKNEEQNKKYERLKKNNEILINAIESGKKKYSRTLKDCETNIFIKEKQIEELKKQLEDDDTNLDKMKKENDKLEKPLRDMQKIIWQIKKERNDKEYQGSLNRKGNDRNKSFNKFKHNRFQSHSFDRMLKKFSERGINTKKYNFNIPNFRKYSGRPINHKHSSFNRNKLDDSFEINNKVTKGNSFMINASYSNIKAKTSRDDIGLRKIKINNSDSDDDNYNINRSRKIKGNQNKNEDINISGYLENEEIENNPIKNKRNNDFEKDFENYNKISDDLDGNDINKMNRNNSQISNNDYNDEDINRKKDNKNILDEDNDDNEVNSKRKKTKKFINEENSESIINKSKKIKNESFEKNSQNSNIIPQNNNNNNINRKTNSNNSLSNNDNFNGKKISNNSLSNNNNSNRKNESNKSLRNYNYSNEKKESNKSLKKVDNYNNYQKENNSISNNTKNSRKAITTKSLKKINFNDTKKENYYNTNYNNENSNLSINRNKNKKNSYNSKLNNLSNSKSENASSNNFFESQKNQNQFNSNKSNKTNNKIKDNNIFNKSSLKKIPISSIPKEGNIFDLDDDENEFLFKINKKKNSNTNKIEDKNIKNKKPKTDRESNKKSKKDNIFDLSSSHSLDDFQNTKPIIGGKKQRYEVIQRERGNFHYKFDPNRYGFLHRFLTQQ